MSSKNLVVDRFVQTPRWRLRARVALHAWILVVKGLPGAFARNLAAQLHVRVMLGRRVYGLVSFRTRPNVTVFILHVVAVGELDLVLIVSFLASTDRAVGIRQAVRSVMIGILEDPADYSP